MINDRKPFNAAAVHAASVFLDANGCVDKVCRIIDEAGKAGARLIVFPESFIPGYPFWIWTHTPTEGAPLFTKLFKNSIEVPGPETDRVGDAARRNGAYVVLGVSERDGGTLYNTLIYFDDHGKLIDKHRKLQPTHAERYIWGRGDGSGMHVVETDIGRVGGLICWEHTMDLARYCLTSQEEQIHFACWPGISALSHNPHAPIFNSVTEAAAKHHALSAQTFVICVQSCIDQETIDIMGLTDQPDMIRVGGGWSAIIGPDGQIISGPNVDTENILYGEIDLDAIIPVKYACDSAGHYSRPDVFRLVTNFNPQEAAVAFEDKIAVGHTGAMHIESGGRRVAALSHDEAIRRAMLQHDEEGVGRDAD